MQGVGALPQGAVAGDLVGGHHGVLRLLRPLGLRVGRQHADRDLAVVLRIGGHRHVRGEELAVQAAERGDELEGGLPAVRVGRHDVVRRLVELLLAFRRGRIVRHGPERVVVEEHARIVHVVARQQIALDLEQVLRVAQVLVQLIADVFLRLHHAREYALPGLENRVFLVELVELHGAVVGIDGRLDRVADVAHLVVDQTLRRAVRVERVLGGLREVLALRVRQGVQGGVAVDDPLDTAIDNRGIRRGIGGQPRSDLLHALARVAVVEHLRVGTDAVRQQEVQLLVLRRVHRAVEVVANGDAAGTGVGVGRVVRVVLHRAGTGIADDDVVEAVIGRRDDRSVVGARLVDLDAQLLLRVVGLTLALGGLAGLRLQVRHGKDRVAATGRTGVAGDLVDLVRLGRDEAVAVGVDGVAVDPVLLVFPQSVRVELAGRHDVVTQLAVGLVAVHRQRVREAVEVAQLLHLAERRREDLRVEQAQVRNRRVVVAGGRGGFALALLVAALFVVALVVLICLGVLGAFRAPVLLVVDLVVGQAEGVAGGVDVAADGFRFLGAAVRLDRELLHEQRPGRADDDGRQQHENHRQARDAQILDHHGGEERDGHDDADDHQNDLRRQVRVDVGVGTTGEDVVLVEQQLVALQPVAGHLEQHPQARDDGESDARGPGNGTAHAGGATADANAAQHVVAEKDNQERDERQRCQRVDHQLPDRQAEGVKAQVLVELRVGFPEVAAVDEQQDGAPVRLQNEPAGQADEQRDDVAEQPQHLFDGLTVLEHR